MDAIIDLIPPSIAAHLPLTNKGYYYADLGANGLVGLVDVAKPSLWIAVGSILFNPIYWNIVARNEYRNKTLSKTFGGAHNACYFLAVTIFSLGIVRDHLYQSALKEQPHLKALAEPAVKVAAVILFVVGQIFVVTSMWALGVTGTYLGDYCGILMKTRVTGFPFNVLNDPMYVGSAMAFLGTALWYESPTGILLSGLVWIVYSIALKYEGPFTDMIYSSAAAKKNDNKGTPKKSTPKKAPVKKDAKATPSTSYAAVAATEPAAPSATVVPSATVAPHTPRKSGRTSARTSEAASGSDANGAATPRRRSSRKSAVAGDGVEASPMRVTRSRSRAPANEDTD